MNENVCEQILLQANSWHWKKVSSGVCYNYSIIVTTKTMGGDTLSQEEHAC